MTSLYLPAPKRSGSASTTTSIAITTGTSSTDLVSSSKNTNTANEQQQQQQKQQIAPSYEERCQAAIHFSKLPPSERSNNKNKLFVPRSINDFDDGGSFPEIHVAQYPKHMGNPHLQKHKAVVAPTSGKTKNSRAANSSSSSRSSTMIGSSSATSQAIVNVEIDSEGNKDYTTLVKSGTNSDKTVYARHSDLKGYTPSPQEIALPSSTEEEEAKNKTQAMINSLLANTMALSKPSGTALQNASTSQNVESKTQFISYTPNPNAPGYNPTTASKRIIQMVPAQLDPMMPPKHKHEKAPPGPADDFTPVLHAPPSKLTKEERDAWNIPACISNWKNTRGYTIPLDKRLAADGRGLRDDTTINSNFATLSESLYLAERNAREEVRMRALVRKRQVENEREKRERELRELAMKAREERGGGGAWTAVSSGNGLSDDRVDNDNIAVPVVRNHNNNKHNDEEDSFSDDYDDNDSTSSNNNNHTESRKANIIPEDNSTVNEEAEKRERIRQERRRERERELRMERHKPNRRPEDDGENEDVAIKKARLGDRDVSEKIALGVHTGSGGDRGGVDGRLYNQSAGLDSGFGADDEYNTYTKPMFDREGVTSSSIYRPTRGEGALDADEQYNKLKSGVTSRFQPDRGFKGAEGGSGAMGGARNAPVQFEKGS